MCKLLDANSKTVNLHTTFYTNDVVKKELKFRVYFSCIIRESNLNLYSHIIIEKHPPTGIYEVFHTLVPHIM